MRVRRVVTGHDQSGKAIFASDDEVEPVVTPLMPGAAFHRLWGADEVLTFPDAGSMPAHETYFPPAGGFRFAFFTVPPASAPGPEGVDVAAALAEFEAQMPGMLAHMEPAEPGMHTTETVDFEVVLSGQITLELDDGVEKTMGPGDTVVQNGTRHRWHNRGTEPAVIAVFLVGANRR